MNLRFWVKLVLSFSLGVNLLLTSSLFFVPRQMPRKSRPLELTATNPSEPLEAGVVSLNNTRKEEELKQQLSQLEEKVRIQEQDRQRRETLDKMKKIASSSYPLELYVYDPPSNVRTLPSTSSEVLCTLNQEGFIYTFGKISKEWHLTYICDGQLGVIHETQVKNTSEL